MAVIETKTDLVKGLSAFSFNLSVPSLDPSNSEGGTGNISLTTSPQDAGNPQKLRNKRFSLSDSYWGEVQGRVSEVRWDASQVSVQAETMLQRLNIEVSLPPSVPTIAQPNPGGDYGMTQALSKAGMTSSGLGTNSEVFPGWFGNLWEYVKMFCVTHDVEPYLDGTYPDTVFFRPIRGSSYDGHDLSALGLVINDQNVAKSIETIVYNYDTPTHNVEFSPFAVDTAQILTVNPGESLDYEIPINGWYRSLNQPVPLDLVGPEERTDSGAYCVAGSDGLPITAAQWVATGGSIVVEPTDNPSVIKVTVTAPKATQLTGVDGLTHDSPYSIAATSGDNTLYNSLHITGSGLRYTPETLVLPTGVNPSISMQDVGATVNNPFVRNLSLGYDLGVRAAQAYAGPQFRVDGVLVSNTEYGDILGARFKQNDTMFRLESITASESSMAFAGTMDTLFDDFNEEWTGKTFANFNSKWAGSTFDDFASASLEA